MKGISEIIATILMLMITLAISGTAYIFISGALTQKTRALNLVDAFCTETSGTIAVRNDGPDVIRAAEQSIIPVDESCTEPAPADIASGAIRIYSFTACGTSRSHTYRLIGPTNPLPISFRCA